MEYLSGVGLETVIKQSAPLPPERVVYLGRQICAGLHHAHCFEAEIDSHPIKGVIHRDIKPSNIFVVSDPTLGETAKILDFGIAKIMSDASVVLGSLTTGFLGTARYSSPEQMRGEQLDARSDIYSLGIVLYQMITRSLPLAPPTDTFAGWYQGHNHDQPRTFPRDTIPHTIPKVLEDVVMACLSKDREQRPQSMQDLSDALGAAMATEGPVLLSQPGLKRRSDPPTPTTYKDPPSPATTPGWLPLALAGGLGFLVLAGGGFLGLQLLSSSDSPTPTPTPPSDPNTPPPNVAIETSQGEQILLPNPNAPTKATGAASLAQGDLRSASALFEAAVNADRNDPESLIYLNNVRALQQGNPVKLAAVVPISSNPDRAKETLRGVAQAQQRFWEQGGLNGRGLELIIGDDGDDADQARAMAQTLADQADILGVVGHNSSGASLAAAEIYEPAGLTMVSSTSTSTRISTLGDAIFRTVPSDQIAGTQLARYALSSLDTKQAAVFYNPASAYSESLKTAFQTTMATEGGQVIAEIDLADPTFEPVSVMASIIEDGAEVIFLAPNNATAPQAIAAGAANQEQPTPLPLLGGDVLFSFSALENGASLTGMVVAVPWHPDIAPNPDFSQAAAEQWGGQVSWRTALAYDATVVLLEALLQAESSSREGVNQAINTPGFTFDQGASGVIRFQPSGDRDAPNILVDIQADPTSSVGYEFVPLP